jgi:hypothetical protein
MADNTIPIDINDIKADQEQENIFLLLASKPCSISHKINYLDFLPFLCSFYVVDIYGWY